MTEENQVSRYGKSISEDRDYWLRRLARFADRAMLVSDFDGRLSAGGREDCVEVIVPENAAQELARLTAKSPLLIYAALLAVFKICLFKYTAASPVIVGSPPRSSGAGTKNNVVPIVTELAEKMTVRDLLLRVRENLLEAYQRQQYPFTRLISDLNLEDSANHCPLFEFAITLEGFHAPLAEVKNDVTLKIYARDEVKTSFIYNPDVFHKASIESLAEHFIHMLNQALGNMGAKISDLELVMPTERDRLMGQCDQLSVPCLPAQTVNELFEARVAESPGAIALRFESETLTYAELNERANRFARHLQRLGVTPETIVAISLERSPEMIVAMLAVLKAGAAYLPLDSTLPAERLRLILEETRPAVVVTQSELTDRIPACTARQILIDRESLAIADLNPANLANQSDGDNLAYVIYTSGSTGRPKGVMLQHAGLCNLVLAQAAGFKIDADSRVLQFASSSFDASVSEIFVTLTAGATLCLGSAERLMPGRELCEWMRAEYITHVTLPPSVLAALPYADLPSLHTLIAAGEVCPPEILELWGAGRHFINAYGPTEATVCATLTGDLLSGAANSRVPIGLPMANVETYILNRQQQLLPVGATGELYVGGAGLARGYLGQGGLTAERFVPHPWSRKAGQRLYRTGDLCRIRHDGQLEYLGRTDEQIKLRGYRIELGEVEAVLNRHEAVRQSAAVVQDRGTEQARLLAYVVGRNEDQKRTIELWPSVAEFFIYDEALYYAMSHDERRNASYRQAIAAAVKDKIVIDVGTGPEAILARMCAAAGARHVYALEVLPGTAQRARARVENEGLQDRITVITGDARQIILPERAAVCVSEIVGPLGGSEGAAVILNDVRERLLEPDGVLIPRRSITRIAGLQLPDEFQVAPGFSEVTRNYVEQIFATCEHRFDLRVSLKGLQPADLITNSGIFEDLDFGNHDQVAPEYRREVSLVVERAGRLDGLLAWLRLETGPGAETLDILEHAHSWLPVYIPVFYPGTDVETGDRLEMVVTGKLNQNQLNPDYEIVGLLVRQDGRMEEFSYRSSHDGPGYRQNPFYEALFADDQIRLFDQKEQPLLRRRLQEHLQKYLPSYMLPSDYVWLASMPLTSSGKIDRQALAVSGRPTGSRPSYVAPRSPTEETLSTIWSEVLKVQKIGINDNFFELGGHSLLATKLITYAGDAFAVELPLLSVFEEPTLAGFAQRVELAQREQKDLSRISEILNQVENLSDDDLSRLLDPGAVA